LLYPRRTGCTGAARLLRLKEGIACTQSQPSATDDTRDHPIVRRLQTLAFHNSGTQLFSAWLVVIPVACIVRHLFVLFSFLRATAECFACLSYGPGVCLSVRLSVSLWSPIKTVQARITKSSLRAAPKTVVFCHL